MPPKKKGNKKQKDDYWYGRQTQFFVILMGLEDHDIRETAFRRKGMEHEEKKKERGRGVEERKQSRSHDCLFSNGFNSRFNHHSNIVPNDTLQDTASTLHPFHTHFSFLPQQLPLYPSTQLLFVFSIMPLSST